jgi:predicted alpha/beta hydrolase family esterase
MKPRLIIHHSFGRKSQSNWYRSVAEALSDTYDVVIPDAPNTAQGRISEWLPAFAALNPDENTVAVGHSLGGDVLLRYLEQPGHKLKAVFLVATPIDDLKWDDLQATGFFAKPFDWPTIVANAEHFFVLASGDDRTVPYAHAESLAANLHARLITFNDKGHFNQDSFPELVTVIKEISQ